MLTEILIIALIAAYIIRYVTKPRFARNAVIYIGSLNYVDGTIPMHKILRFKKVKLGDFNKFRYLWNPFKPLTIGRDEYLTISVSAAKGYRIVCNERFPWYTAHELESKDRHKLARIGSPKELYEAMRKWTDKSLLIKEIPPVDVIKDDKKKTNKRTIKANGTYYYVDASTKITEVGGESVAKDIERAKIFCYTTE